MVVDVVELDQVTVRFGAVHAVDEVSFAAHSGEILGVIGPNGAGKTTLLNAISGLLPLAGGSIRLAGNEIKGLRPDQVTALGVGRTFQAAEVFNDFRVIDYMLLGRFGRHRKSIAGAALRLPWVTRLERADNHAAMELLARFGLERMAAEPLKELPYGLRKLIDLLRAMFGEHKLLLLDEPTSGTASNDRTLLREVLAGLHDRGVTVVVVDHDVQFVADLCDRVVAMNFGRVLGVGTPSEVLGLTDVRVAYLGMDVEEA